MITSTREVIITSILQEFDQKTMVSGIVLVQVHSVKKNKNENTNEKDFPKTIS